MCLLGYHADARNADTDPTHTLNPEVSLTLTLPDCAPCHAQLLSNHGLLSARPAQHMFETPSHEAAIPLHAEVAEA